MTDIKIEELPEVERIERMALRPTDVFVLECPRSLTPELADRIVAYMTAQFPDHKCLVLSDGIKLKIITEEEANEAEPVHPTP